MPGSTNSHAGLCMRSGKITSDAVFGRPNCPLLNLVVSAFNILDRKCLPDFSKLGDPPRLSFSVGGHG